MKNFLKTLPVFTVAILFFAACSKMDDLPHYNNGNLIELTSSSTTLTPTVNDSNNVVVSFSWTNPHYATDTATYKFVLEIDSAGRNFSKAVTKEITAAYSTSLTGRELNAILLGYGLTIGAPYNLEVRIASSYANNNERYYSNVINLSVTPFNDPSTLTTSTNDITLDFATAGDFANVFNWSPSFAGYTGNISYTLEYDSAGKRFTTPNTIPVTAGHLYDSLLQSELNETAIQSGIAGGSAGVVEYRIKALTALGAISYSNVVTINIHSYQSILRFYMPGNYQTSTGNGTDWPPDDAPELIRDLRPGLLNDMYYIYIYLPANTEFKFTQGRSWGINYGQTGPNTLSTSGGNITVATAGFYRITISRATLQYDVRVGRMAFVGQLNNWDPPTVFPDYMLAAAGTNLFIGVADFAVTGGWKLIDNNQWNSGSNSVDETRTYGTANPPGSMVEVNGPNFPDVTATGLYRAIWDGRDRDNVKYDFMDASIMKLVGDGINSPGVNDWDPPSSPLMTYSGNGVWTITIGLKANKDIKFLAGANWGALDYEDNSSQSQATGVPKGIKWEGGDNFKTPAADGTYTITLNENTQTMEIN